MAVHLLESSTDGGNFKTIIDLNKVNECKSKFDEAKDSVTEVIDAFNKETFNHYDINGLKEVYENIKNTSLKIKAINERISRSMQTYEEKVTENETNLCNNMDGVTEFIGSGTDGAFGGTVSDNVKVLINNNNPKGNYHFSLKNTSEAFVDKYLGIAIDNNGNGVWCYDVITQFMIDNGYAPIGTSNGYASGIWYDYENGKSGATDCFEFIPINEIDQHGGLQNGDFAIWDGSYYMTPLSHVGMYYNGLCFQQSKNKGCHLADYIDFSKAKGILRPKIWSGNA